jgi:hypothetical protein
LDNQQNNNKPKKSFTIISGDSTDGHGGYGIGSISLNNVTPVIVDPTEDQVYIDMGAMHARSAVEKRIKFKPDRENAPNGKLYWLVWVTILRGEKGPYYVGVAGCEMRIDADTRRGYKNLPEHVNRMDKSMKGHIIVDDMDEKSKKLLGSFLKEHNLEYWNHSSDELKEKLLDKN